MPDDALPDAEVGLTAVSAGENGLGKIMSAKSTVGTSDVLDGIAISLLGVDGGNGCIPGLRVEWPGVLSTAP